MRQLSLSALVLLGCGASASSPSPEVDGESAGTAATPAEATAVAGAPAVDVPADAPDSDAPTTEPAATHWCARQPLLASPDSLCVDFDDDEGLLPGWSEYAFNSGGTMSLSEVSESAPFSLRIESPGQNLRQWISEGPTRVTSVKIRASVRPDAEPTPDERPFPTQLFCAAAGRTEGCLMHATGAQTTFAASYTGYYLQWKEQAMSVHPSVRVQDCPVESGLAPEVWSDVVLRLEGDGVHARTSSGEASCDGVLDGATSTTVSIGLASPSPWGAHLDNLTVEVSRE